MEEFNPAKKFETVEHQGIQVRNLNVIIGDAHILKDVTVDIPKNKITCILPRM